MRKRTDANHKEIVKALRDAGISVIDLHEVGKDCPDILAGGNVRTKSLQYSVFWKENVLIEIKDGNKKPSARKLRPGQKKLQETWKGLPIRTVTNKQEALAIFGIE